MSTSPEAEEPENEQNNDDGPNEPNDAIHVFFLVSCDEVLLHRIADYLRSFSEAADKYPFWARIGESPGIVMYLADCSGVIKEAESSGLK